MTTNITPVGSIPYNDPSSLGEITAILDFGATGAATGANEVVPILSIPAGTVVLGVWWSVLEAEGAAQTFDIGDGAQVNGYVDGANGNVVAAAVGAAATWLNTGGMQVSSKLYTAADTIDIKTIDACDNMRIMVTALVWTPVARNT